MGKQPSKSVEDKNRIVLAVLRGEISIAEAARPEGTSQVSISKWRDQFLAGGQQALAEGARHGPTGREQALQAEVERAAPPALREAKFGVEQRIRQARGRQQVIAALREDYCALRDAIISISTLAPIGRAATAMVERAG